MRDAMEALREVVLLPANGIVELIGDRCYVNRIPRDVLESMDTFHPAKTLVLRQAGGAGSADFLPIDRPAVTVLAYGESDFEADRLRRRVWQLFSRLARYRSAGNVLVHHINPTGGAIPLVDPDIVWPAMAQTYTITADVVEEA